MDQNLDRVGGSPKEKRSVKFPNDICLNYDLIEIRRTRNPDSTLFTWKRDKPLIERRLDSYDRQKSFMGLNQMPHKTIYDEICQKQGL